MLFGAPYNFSVNNSPTAAISFGFASVLVNTRVRSANFLFFSNRFKTVAFPLLKNAEVVSHPEEECKNKMQSLRWPSDCCKD